MMGDVSPEEDYHWPLTALKSLPKYDVAYDLPHALAPGPFWKSGSIPEW
jgi:hypothetical protein